MTPPLGKINVGTVPNDGTGDPLRVAFQTTNTAIESVDDVQLALGVAEGSTTLGDDTEVAGASDVGDSVLDRFQKHGGRITDLEAEVDHTLLTQNDASATHFAKSDDADWTEFLAAGFYKVTITAGGGTNSLYPYVPNGLATPFEPTPTLDYSIQIERTGALTGIATARVSHGTRSGAIRAQRTYRANLTLASGGATEWSTETVIWREVGGSDDQLLSILPGASHAPYELWLKWGQSNSAGADHTAGVDQGDFEPYYLDAPHPRVHEISHGLGDRADYYSAPQYKPHMLRAPASDDQSFIGPGQSFGVARADRYPGIKSVCLSCRAVGGAGLVGVNWDPALVDPTSTFNVAIDEAEQFLELNPEYVFAGILWQQGEYDAGAKRTRAEYEAKLGLLIDTVRSRLRGGDQSVFICGTIKKSWRENTGISGTPPATAPDIHAAHLNIATLRERCAYVDFDDLNRSSDEVHYGRDDLRTIGYRYATTAEKLLSITGLVSMPSYKFEYDGQTFSNSLGTGGKLFAPQVTSDGTRGMVLDTNRAGTIAGIPADIVLNGRAYTIAMFVRPRAISDFKSFFCGHANTAAQGHFWLYGQISHGQQQAAQTAGALGYVDGETVPTAAWTHVALTYDGTEFVIFKNGVKVDFELNIATDPLVKPSMGYIGGYGQLASWSMDAQFDKVVILPYVAADTTIAALAAE